MFTELLDKHFIPILLLILLTMILRNTRGSADRSQRWYWMTVICTAVLIAADALEAWASYDPSMRFWRIVFSVVGYIMRPATAASVAFILYPRNPPPFALWIPCLLNAAVYLTAFFSPVAFGFTETYNFSRGPLGYTVFIVSFFYLILCIVITSRRFRDRDHARERFVIYLCAVACFAAAVLDSETDGTHLNAVILISVVFLFFFLRAIDVNRDALTGLQNRKAFFEDVARLSTAVTAVASADMNGLKAINDAIGHEAGDEALRAIGKCMEAVSSKNIYTYRTGGDEFALLFIRLSEEPVKESLQKLSSLVTTRGYSISLGYAMRGQTFASTQDLIRWADERMYESKTLYYQDHQHDRRRGSARRPAP